MKVKLGLARKDKGGIRENYLTRLTTSMVSPSGAGITDTPPEMLTHGKGSFKSRPGGHNQ